MIISMKKFVIFNSLVLIYFLLQSFTYASKPKTLVVRLIHRDSANSPFYNPKHGIKDRADRILKNSLAHFNYLKRKRKISFLAEQDDVTTYQAEIETYDYGFLVNLSIGQPLVPQLVVLDTGSRMLWVQCSPCQRCYKQKTPIYDPSLSSSYHNLSCNDSICRPVPNANCDSSGNCVCHISYMDNSMSRGNIATEKITFHTPDEGVGVLNDVVLGCGYDNYLRALQPVSGILGLGFTETIGIMSKIESRRFSYCIGDYHDPNYLFNQLILGDSAIFEGDSTELELDNGYYYLTLEGISLGEERLKIDSNLFRRDYTNGEGGTIIDSGCELTMMNEVAYGAIREKVDSIARRILWPFVFLFDRQRLCYIGVISRDLVGFPTATFHFGNEADLVLDIQSLFYQKNDFVFCLAMVPVASGERTIIGLLAQQYYNVGYDIAEKLLYFQRIDCQVLQS